MERLLDEARGRLDESGSGLRLELANATQQLHDELDRADRRRPRLRWKTAAKDVRPTHASKLEELAQQVAVFRAGRGRAGGDDRGELRRRRALAAAEERAAEVVGRSRA